MSYYFVIVGTQDNPLFEYEFGTSKQGGDGAAHFADQARSMNQFIVHSSLDILEEVQWSNGQMYAHPYLPPPRTSLPCFLPDPTRRGTSQHTGSTSRGQKPPVPEARMTLTSRRGAGTSST